MTYLNSVNPRIAPPRLIWATLAIVAAWLTLIIFLGRNDFFHVGIDSPPVRTLIAMLLPPLLFLIAMRNADFRAQVLEINPFWLNGMQGLRILGAGFLFVAAYGHLPGIFAFFAGWGDIFVAFMAPLIIAKLAADKAFIGSRRFLVFHIIGLLDFAGAVLSGLVSRGTIPFVDNPQSTEALASFPLLIIPCFAVPLWICLHIASLAQRRAYLVKAE